MAIHTEEIREMQGGFDKTIEASALGMIYDNLQKYQYQYPIKSTIRELVSNAVDAVGEKIKAKAILSGLAKEEDFFIRRDDALYKDSNFDPTYYDPKWLGSNDEVLISYREGGVGKDYVHVIDQGVGLWGPRLEGYFKLGYSTKRNAKFALGKFGIGAKAALSTNIEYYTVINRYNGAEFQFNVYGHKVDSVVPPLDLATGAKNPSVTFSNGYVAHYRATTQPNGLEVIIETKKHKKQEFIEAVKSQLLYFEGVRLEVVKENGYRENIPTRANVLFENEYLIVSDNNQYSKPHLVINKVNYGYVDFNELELEVKMGNVGIKVAAEEVQVNPSRESVIWSEQTKETIQQRFRQAAKIATDLIQDKLKTDDFITWLRTWSSIKRNYVNKSSTDVVSRLAGIVNLEELQPSFSLDPTLRAGLMKMLFPGIRVQRIRVEQKYKGGKTYRKLERSDVMYASDMDSTIPVVVTDSKPGTKKLRYLATQNSNGFYLIWYPKDNERTHVQADSIQLEVEDTDDWTEDFNLTRLAAQIYKEEGINRDAELHTIKGKSASDIVMVLKDRRGRVIDFIKKSTVALRLETVSVPDSFQWGEEEDVVEAQIAQEQKLRNMSPEDRRKLEQRVVAFTPRGFDNTPWKVNSNDMVRLFEWQKIEPKLGEVQNLDGEEVYYGSSKDEELIHMVAAISRPVNGSMYAENKQFSYYRDDAKEFRERWGLSSYDYKQKYLNNWGPDARVTLLKVAEDQKKHYTNYRHITEFFQRVEGKTLTMSRLLIDWHTARIISERIHDLRFLAGYSAFDAEVAEKYRKLLAFFKENYRDISEYSRKGNYFGLQKDMYEQVLAHHDKVAQLQLFIRQNQDDAEAIADMSKTLFNAELEHAHGLNLEYYDLYNELLEYASPIHNLLNHLKVLTDVGTLTPELEAEVRFYLSSKGL